MMVPAQWTQAWAVAMRTPTPGHQLDPGRVQSPSCSFVKWRLWVVMRACVYVCTWGVGSS